MNEHPVVDVHTHLVAKGWPDLAGECGGEGWPWLRMDSERDAMLMLGDAEFRAVGSPCWDIDERLADMDADGIDVQVVSPTPVFFNYDRPADQAVKVARIFNDLNLQCVDHARLIPFCQVPLQDPAAACAELDRCLAAGHRGVEIGNHVGDLDLDDPGIVEFFQHCAAVGAPVLVHPWDMPKGARAERWMAEWLVGMPAETHLSLLSMVLGGVFDQVPDSLRICFAHGGGSFAFWLGRMDNAWHRRNDVVRGHSEHPPSHYVDRFFVDSVVFDQAPLRLLVDTLGDDQVIVGSDYPYPFGERPVGQVVRDAEFLSPHQRHQLLSANAVRFLGLSARALNRAGGSGNAVDAGRGSRSADAGTAPRS